jgi:hypothetical protein
MAITETHLHKNIYPAETALPGFTQHCAVRPVRKGGGVILYVSENVDTTLSAVFANDTVESVFVFCPTLNQIIIVMYRPPSTSLLLLKEAMNWIHFQLSNILKSAKVTPII